jgi:flagellar motility protein MotE (MotC chaperone)
MARSRRIFAMLGLICLFFLVAVGWAPRAQNTTADWSKAEEIRSVEERRILTSLKKERKELRQKKDRIAKREKELKVMQTEVEKKLQRLREWRNDLEELLNQKERKEHKRVKKLSRIYQRMEPQKAAAALGSVEQDLAVGIISGMRSGTAAEVLDNMDKEKAAALSTDLSNLDRN